MSPFSYLILRRNRKNMFLAASFQCSKLIRMFSWLRLKGLTKAVTKLVHPDQMILGQNGYFSNNIKRFAFKFLNWANACSHPSLALSLDARNRRCLIGWSRNICLPVSPLFIKWNWASLNWWIAFPYLLFLPVQKHLAQQRYILPIKLTLDPQSFSACSTTGAGLCHRAPQHSPPPRVSPRHTSPRLELLHLEVIQK